MTLSIACDYKIREVSSMTVV